MKTQIILIFPILLLIITFVSATYYSGDTMIIPLDFKIVNCSISGNTYNLEGLDLSWEGKNIIISTPPLYQPDTFLVNCLVIKEEEIIELHYPWSGGGSSYTCKENWQCIDWAICINEIQKRTCWDLNKCGTENKRPIEERACTEQNKEEEIKESNITPQALEGTNGNKGLISGITGAVTGVLGKAKGLIIIIFITLVLGLSLIVRFVRRKDIEV